jgi:hypothetical protein
MKWTIIIIIIAQIFLANCIRIHSNKRIDTIESIQKEIDAQKKIIYNKEYALKRDGKRDGQKDVDKDKSLEHEQQNLKKLEEKLEKFMKKQAEDKENEELKKEREKKNDENTKKSNEALIDASKFNRPKGANLTQKVKTD